MKSHHELIHSNYTIRKLHKESGYDHWHHKMELIYILSGVCEITIEKNKSTCTAGDIAVVHSGENHSIKDVNNSTLYICTFDPDILHYFHSDTRYIKSFISCNVLKHAGIDQCILQTFENIFQENASRETLHDALIRSDIIKVYSLLVRHFEREPKETPPISRDPPKFQKALLYIEENYNQSITLSDIARITHYNTCYVSSLFVSHTGLNFKTYLDNVRIKKAIILIEQTDLTIADIAEQCGFHSIRTFNNVFRKIKGIAPSKFRRVNN